jgi:hypothetical protein
MSLCLDHCSNAFCYNVSNCILIHSHLLTISLLFQVLISVMCRIPELVIAYRSFTYRGTRAGKELGARARNARSVNPCLSPHFNMLTGRPCCNGKPPRSQIFFEPTHHTFQFEHDADPAALSLRSLGPSRCNPLPNGSGPTRARPPSQLTRSPLG